jgi:hypothetical protein
MLMVFAGRPSGASAILAKDGYTVADSMNQGQITAYLSSGAAGQDAKAIQGMVTGGAEGISKDGSRAEVVIGLNQAGVDLYTVAVPLMNHGIGSYHLPAGVTVHMDGSNLVIDGPEPMIDGG